MPLPVAPPETALSRFFLVVAGVPVPFHPTGSAKLSRAPQDNTDAGAFFLRDKLGELSCAGDEAYRLLRAQDQSADRCRPLGILAETREHLSAPFQLEYSGTFTCNECAFDLDHNSVSFTPTTDDAYRQVLENWDEEVNLLSTPGGETRVAVSAELATLSAGTKIEWLRIDNDQEGDYAQDGWTVFLRNTSYIDGGGFGGSTSEHYALIFRYRLQAVPMTNTAGQYTAVDKSAGGWQVLAGSETNGGPSGKTVDYVKTPSIAGFRPYVIKDYKDWWSDDGLTTGFFGRQPKYGQQLLLIPCNATPSAYGFNNADYLKVTGSGGGQSLGGAQNDDTAPCLNVRKNVGTDNTKSLWWRFGSFRFGRCFPLLEGLKQLLTLTLTPWGAQGLIPPTTALLSEFFSAATNPATGATGTTNEVPGLLLSAASDVKRYGASEPADRLLISLKQFLSDLGALYDVGWFIDPQTGWFRIEHRAYLETQRSSAPVLDLTAIPEAILPRAFKYRQLALPRYEELSVAAGSTEDTVNNVRFGKAAIRYDGLCANPREGQNRTTQTSARLSGDVAAMVLNGENVPDSAIALLAAGPDGRLIEANRPVSVTKLLLRYHRRGRVQATGADVDGEPLLVQSVRPAVEQEGCSLYVGSLRALGTAATRLTTSLGTNGQLAKAELDLLTGTVVLTVNLPGPSSSTPGPVPAGRQFSDSYNDSYR